MKRRRTRALPGDEEDEDEEEEEEEEESTSDRRESLRKRKKVNYRIDAPVDGEDEEEEDEEDEDDEEGEHGQTTLGNSPLPVTCGTRKGMMDPGKLSRGEPCIEYQGDFFTPPEFEDIAGKSRAKKWKQTILYKKNPLQYYFDKEQLTTVGYHRRRRETAKQTTPSGSESPFSEEESITSKNDGEDVMLIEDSEDERFRPENDRKVRVLAERREEDEEVTDNHADNDAAEECIQTIATAVYEHVAKKMQVKVALERIQLQVVGPAAESDSCCPPQARRDDQTSSMELPEQERLCEDEDEHNSPAADSPQIPDPLSTADVPGASTSPLNVQTEDPGETDVLSSGLHAGQPHGIKLETSSPQTPKASDCIQEEPTFNAGPYILQTSTIKALEDIQEEPTHHGPSGPPSDEDSADIDQMKREKLKMQLKVLKLQEEYYTLRIRKLKE